MPSVPYTSNPSSAVPSRTNEMVMYTGPHATSQQGSGPHRGPISNTNMAYSGPTMQRVSSSPNTSASGAYQADFSRFKEDLAGVLKSKLGIDMGGSRLYQKPYPPEFDFFHILLVCVFPSLSNSMVKILVRLGNMLANISCNWEKRVLMMPCGFVCFLCL